MDRTRRHLAAAAELEAPVLFVLPGHGAALSWEDAAARARPLLEALLPTSRACSLGSRAALARGRRAAG